MAKNMKECQECLNGKHCDKHKVKEKPKPVIVKPKVAAPAPLSQRVPPRTAPASKRYYLPSKTLDNRSANVTSTKSKEGYLKSHTNHLFGANYNT